MGDHEGTFKIEFDDFTMKTKLNLTRFRGTIGTLRFNEKSFFHTLIGFTPHWNYKPTKAIRADRRDVYTSDKNLNLDTIDNIHLKTNVIEGSVVNKIFKPTLFGFVFDKPTGYEFFASLKQLIIKE